MTNIFLREKVRIQRIEIRLVVSTKVLTKCSTRHKDISRLTTKDTRMICYKFCRLKGYPHSMMILAYLRMKFSSLKINSDRSLSVARQPRRSSSAFDRPPSPIDPPPTGTASRTCLRAPVAAMALTAALRLVAPGAWSSTSASSPSDTSECGILRKPDRLLLSLSFI